MWRFNSENPLITASVCVGTKKVSRLKRDFLAQVWTHTSNLFKNPSDIYTTGAKGIGQLIHRVIGPNHDSYNTKPK